MLRIRHFALSLPLVVFSSVPSPGADSPAIATLKEKGLTRSGRLFVIEAEKPALEKWKGTRALLADYAAIAERRNEAELAAREQARLQDRRAELQDQLDQLNERINEQGLQQGNNRPGGFGQGSYVSQLIWQRNLIRTNLAQVVSMQESAKAGAATDQKTLEAESKKSLEAVKAALAEFRESVDAVTKQYDQLNADSSVRSALRALEKDRMGTFKLGPSAPFRTAVTALEAAERRILEKRTATASRKKGKSRS